MGHTKHFRLDLLIYRWFQQQSRGQRKQAQDSRKNHRNDRVAIHRSDIHASYELIDGIAYIVLPKIRFEESDCQLIANGNRPQVVISLDGKEIYTEPMKIFGNQVFTSREYRFLLNQVQSANLHFSVKVIIGDNNHVIYDSHKTLYRDYLILSRNMGHEIRNIQKTADGAAYLFTPLESDVDFDEDSGDIYTVECDFAQKFALDVNALHCLTVNGIELYGEGKDVPMHRPEREYKSDDYYIGDPTRNVIDTLSFSVNENNIEIESTSNDSLVVVVRSPEYAVCPVCGYATDDPFPKKHKNPYGYYCKNEEAISKKYILSHDFKTDVAKIVFQTPAASDTNTMLSVLYALLEGMSTALGIERTDIKGTLHKVNWNNRLIYSIILYDAVAGGAGHVRRIVTKDGAAFQNVLHAAYDLVQGCDCDTSCYKCLRNYYNQKIHDQLDRHIAANFIKPWLGVMKPIEEQQQEEATTAECERNSSLDTVLHTDCEYDEDSTSWNEIIENLPLTDSDAEWVSALQKIAERDFLPFPVQSAHITVERSNDELWPDMAWPNLKLALYTSDNTDEYDNWPNCDWKAYKIGDDTLTPEKFAEIIRNTTIR